MPYVFDRTMDVHHIYTERQIDFLSPELKSKCKRHVFKPGDVICRKGDMIRCIRFIESGSCAEAAYSTEGTLRSNFTIDPTNGSIGLMEIFCLQRRFVSSIVAVEPMVIWDLPVKYVYEDIMTDPNLVLKYCFILAKALLASSDQQSLLYLQSSDRVRHFLARYCSSVMQEDSVVVIRESYDSIGAQIGLSGKTVARIIRKLISEGAVSKSGKHISMTYDQYIRMLQ